MFKKTLTAAALLAAFGSAYAANVTLYGRADLGLSYNNVTYGHTGSKDIEADSFQMDSGNSTGSRFGLKGTEDLGNGLKVGFVLENGFNPDTGKLKTEGSIFDREATLSLSGAFGTVYAGRMATVYSDAGSVGIYGAAVSPFGTGWGELAGHTTIEAAHATRYNNALAYVSPSIAGTQIFAQYTMGNSDENTSKSDRYAALGAIYNGSKITLAGMVDWTNRATALSTGVVEADDSFTINIGGSYDCGYAKTYVAAQYFKDASDVASIVSTFNGKFGSATLTAADLSSLNANGWSATLGVDVPALGGLAKLAVGYTGGDFDARGNAGEKPDLNAWNITAGYQYSLSKRTSLYCAAGYLYREVKNSAEKYQEDRYQAMAGLVHKF